MKARVPDPGEWGAHKALLAAAGAGARGEPKAQRSYVTLNLRLAALERAYRRCLADRHAWARLRSDLIRCAWRALKCRVLSNKVVRENDIDDGTYTTLERKQVEDVFKRVKCDEEDIDDQLAEMREYLKKRIRDLKRIFTFYAASNDSGATDSEMDRYEFWKLVKDCKLQRNRKALPSVRVDLIFQKCQMNMALEGKERTLSMTEELPSKKFVVCLLRLASYRYSSGTLPERLERMMEMEVIPNACSTETDRFRETLHTDKVEAMLDRFRKPLKMLFRHYAADDQSGAAALATDTMNVQELQTMCRDLKLVGPRLSLRACRTIFAFVQQEEAALEDNEDADDDDESEMVFAEFREATAALSVWMRPDPYEKMADKIRNFLCETVFPAAKKLYFFKFLRWDNRKEK